MERGNKWDWGGGSVLRKVDNRFFFKMEEQQKQGLEGTNDKMICTKVRGHVSR